MSQLAGCGSSKQASTNLDESADSNDLVSEEIIETPTTSTSTFVCETSESDHAIDSDAVSPVPTLSALEFSGLAKIQNRWLIDQLTDSFIPQQNLLLSSLENWWVTAIIDAASYGNTRAEFEQARSGELSTSHPGDWLAAFNTYLGDHSRITEADKPIADFWVASPHPLAEQFTQDLKFASGEEGHYLDFTQQNAQLRIEISDAFGEETLQALNDLDDSYSRALFIAKVDHKFIWDAQDQRTFDGVFESPDDTWQEVSLIELSGNFYQSDTEDYLIQKVNSQTTGFSLYKLEPKSNVRGLIKMDIANAFDDLNSLTWSPIDHVILPSYSVNEEENASYEPKDLFEHSSSLLHGDLRRAFPTGGLYTSNMKYSGAATMEESGLNFTGQSSHLFRFDSANCTYTLTGVTVSTGLTGFGLTGTGSSYCTALTPDLKPFFWVLVDDNSSAIWAVGYVGSLKGRSLGTQCNSIDET
ncbi:hypothetical protein [Hahella sp. CCB-MM4]|uniref:hypothetical protein n=1 Tax=Hahella sp. (strain CCB-MM4) TaxID=1926491 RepID=UPI00143DDA05|nr:hypothetical protein [Hahella sp. CCB-MM4]